MSPGLFKAYRESDTHRPKDRSTHPTGPRVKKIPNPKLSPSPKEKTETNIKIQMIKTGASTYAFFGF
jgi:hypothetical protein